MESTKRRCSKITGVVKLQQILKKWKKLAVGSSGAINKFLKGTLSFSGNEAAAAVPKGYLAVSVGEEMRRFVIPTEYLSHRAFAALLGKAEEEFGFAQEGVLRIPSKTNREDRNPRSFWRASKPTAVVPFAALLLLLLLHHNHHQPNV